MNNNLEDTIDEWPGLKAKGNFFSINTLKDIKSQIKKAKFDRVYQEREAHYSHVFKSLNNRITEAESHTYQIIIRQLMLKLKNS